MAVNCQQSISTSGTPPPPPPPPYPLPKKGPVLFLLKFGVNFENLHHLSNLSVICQCRLCFYAYLEVCSSVKILHGCYELVILANAVSHACKSLTHLSHPTSLCLSL